jgi:hypothetical protein
MAFILIPLHDDVDWANPRGVARYDGYREATVLRWFATQLSHARQASGMVPVAIPCAIRHASGVRRENRTCRDAVGRPRLRHVAWMIEAEYRVSGISHVRARCASVAVTPESGCSSATDPGLLLSPRLSIELASAALSQHVDSA